MRYLPLLTGLLVLASCGDSLVTEQDSLPQTGPWLVTMDIGDDMLPFEMELVHDGDDWDALILNADERIEVEDVLITTDSFRLRMPLFDSEFIGMFSDDRTLKGTWTNFLKGSDYQLPFTAQHGIIDRFSGDVSNDNISGTWQVIFSPNTNESYPAIGNFTQVHNSVSGTFITETGDYRYLEGVMSGDSLFLSCFDGSHAFLFKASLADGQLSGVFHSGKHWTEPWSAVRNKEALLTHPDSLTHLKEGYDMIDMSFTDIDGNTVGPKVAGFEGKVVLLQVMGTWCPNCVDETRLLTEAHERYSKDGMEVIALAFEKYKEPYKARQALIDFRNELNVAYPLVHAGYSSKDSASKVLPFLDHVMSYPTCIVIDRRGLVRKIRTGFYGPGTGEHYTVYKKEFLGFIEELLREG